MIPLEPPVTRLDSSELESLAELLKKYDFRYTVPQLAGLLTVPSLHANTPRLETIVHLAVACCRGRRKPKLTSINQWLNEQLGNTSIVMLEDPSEDVFITNVETPEGNRRIFEGIWNSNDYFVQVVIDILRSHQTPQECQNLLYPAFALLKISDCVAERVGLQRWHVESSTPGNKARLVPSIGVVNRAHAVTFTDRDLDILGINRDILTPFIFPIEGRQHLLTEIIGHTSLEKCPLVDIDGKLVLSLPNAVSPAIRRFVLSELRQMGYLSAFTSELADYQAGQVQMYGFRELKKNNDSLNLPSSDEWTPPLHDWLFKYDIDKYLHLVLLQDPLTELDAENLTSLLEYSTRTEADLKKYLDKVANYCISRPDFSAGMTLLIIGGIGRDFTMVLEDEIDRWDYSIIRTFDFLMLVNDPDKQAIRYLKFINQKKWLEREGVEIFNSGDYNFYCFWRQSNYQLVVPEVPLRSGSAVLIADDYTLPVREKVRNILDRHIVQTTKGFYVTVIRFGNNTYFESINDRPIYVSLAHWESGILAGVVETTRGPSWLIAKRQEANEKVLRIHYRIWEGFIGLYDKLVFEVESLYKKAPAGPIEIQLDFSEVIVSDYLEPQEQMAINEPKIVVDFNQRTAVIKFPSEIIQYFQQPENTGEAMVLQSIAKGLIRIHRGTNKDVEEGNLNDLINKVISDSNIRVLHVFQIYDPVEQLQMIRNMNPIFLAQEDFVFSKLKLSEGCKPDQNDTSIQSKDECNKFLHKTVGKIWNQLRILLQQIDRISLIHEVLRVHEAIIHDREHWRRTSRAILALYAPTDDVQSIAQEREMDRVNTAISARTILEMAICECSEEGGRPLSQFELDELLAKVALLIGVATDSDAIENDLTTPRIDLLPNGEYTIDRNFHDAVIEPFRTAHFIEEFEKNVQGYSELYKKEPSGGQKQANEIFSSDFIHAFRAEFGLTLDEMISGFGELIDIAVENNNIVVDTTLGKIKDRLIENCSLSIDASEAFVRTFGIFHRRAWDTPPKGFKGKDIYPWRFSRRLSLTSKPILIFGQQDKDRVLFGVGALKLGIGLLLSRIEQGHLSQDFFISAEMKRYIGSVNDKKGHAFAQSVAKQLSEKGWHVRNEVQMTELGASAKLGDVDVLAWKSSGKIQIIECKRLRLARSVAEVAEICRRFRGEAKDELGKHVRRVNWIKTNPEGLQHIIGLTPNPARIDDRLVTNTHVPMTYLTSLPIEPSKIGPLK